MPPANASPPASPESVAKDNSAALLALVDAVASELHPEAPPPAATLDAVLDRELGIDSLGRAELIGRIERTFGVSLPEQVFGTVESPRDLLRAIEAALPREPTAVSLGPIVPPSGGEARPAPASARTLVDVLEWHAAAHAERLHIRLYRDDDDGEAIHYGELHARARAVAAGLQRAGVQPGDRITLMLPTGADYFFAFYGALFAGAVPVPIYPPARRSQLEDHLRRQASILRNCQPSVLITVAEAKAAGRLLSSRVTTLRQLTTVAELIDGGGSYQRPAIAADDIALLQYTSGSTGDPKGVVLSHANLMANIHADAERIQAGSDDVFVSWLPLYHDMGLIGAWLGSACYAIPLVVMSPLAFLGRPRRWFAAIHRYGGTLSAAPNFAYDLCLNRLDDADLEGLDLSSWRLAFNGAEAVSAETVVRFCERFAPIGFRAETMYPVYGLAESAVGLTFPTLGRGPLIDRVQREALTRDGRALPAEATDPSALRFVACGHPLAGHEIRIVDAADRELPERQQGRIQFRGPSSTSGYYRNVDATRKLFHDSWLDTGDLGYVAGADLYITGRVKDVIIRAGRNIYPEELEAALGDIEGVRSGRVAVFASADADTGTERLVVLAETRKRAEPDRERLRAEIRAVTTDLAGIPPDVIVLAPPNTVLKTSSGKLRRAASRSLYERGAIGQPARPPWLQLTRFVLASLGPQLRRGGRSIAGAAYAAWAWLAFAVAATITGVVIMLAPRAALRWAVMRRAARGLAWSTATPLTVRGAEQLPATPCVLVCNHASYLDAFVLVGTLPRTFTFVVKQDVAPVPGLRRFLRRIGAVQIERFDAQAAAAEHDRMTALARAGLSVLFFPEGTFTRIPGLLPFHMGAFVTAAEADVPVVPIAIRGSRSILRSGSWYPRRGSITVTVGAPIPVPDAADRWHAALTLRDAARAHILRHCGEPDLTHGQVRGTGRVIGWGD